MQCLTRKVREISSLVSSEKTDSNFNFTISIRSICLILRALRFLIFIVEMMVMLRAFGPSLQVWPPRGQVTTLHDGAQGLSCSSANRLFGCIIYKVL